MAAAIKAPATAQPMPMPAAAPGLIDFESVCRVEADPEAPVGVTEVLDVFVFLGAVPEVDPNGCELVCVAAVGSGVDVGLSLGE